MLAPNYFNWPGKVWIISDLHFGDKGILTYERTKFKNPEEHDEFLIKVINQTIQKTDTFVCLGDLGIRWEEPLSKIKNCARKILIMGNHDHDNKTKYKKYFDEVYPGPLFVNKFTVLSHEPIPVSEHFINIHGHLHNSYLDDEHHVNVSIAMAKYKLFPLDDIYNKVQNYPRIRASFLKEWYADKYIFTDTRKDCLMYSDNLHIIPMKKIQEAIKIIENIILDDSKKEEIEKSEKISNFFLSTRLFKGQDIRLKTKSTDPAYNLAEELIKVWEELHVEKE